MSETLRPWWRSRARHEEIQKDEAIQARLRTAADKPFPDVRPADPASPSWGTPEIYAFAELVHDNPDRARSLVRAMSARDRAMLGFYLYTLSCVVQEEDSFQEDADRKAARRTHVAGQGDPDKTEVPLQDI